MALKVLNDMEKLDHEPPKAAPILVTVLPRAQGGYSADLRCIFI